MVNRKFAAIVLAVGLLLSISCVVSQSEAPAGGGSWGISGSSETFESPAGSSSWSGTMELNIDLPGVNLDQGYTLSSTDDAHVCANYCANNPNCMAFTYVRPGIQGPNAVCWLKKSVPRPFPSDCCISGIKFAPPEAAATSARPSISGSEAPTGGSSWGQSPPHIGWIDREPEIPIGGGSWGQSSASCISCEPDYQCLDNLTAARMGLPLWIYVDFSQCCITANFEFGHCWLSKASSPVDRWN
jgi:PAN domain